MRFLHASFFAGLGLTLGALASTALEAVLLSTPRFGPQPPVELERQPSLSPVTLGALLELPDHADASASPPEEAPLPQPHLVGTLAPTFAAIIDDDGHMRTLAVGETLGETSVVAVEHFAVTFSHRGRRFRAEVAHPAARRPSTPGAIVLPRSAVDRALGSFSELLATTQFVPVFSEGPNRTLSGFRLQRLGDRSILSTVGLLPQDIIQQVNGLDLSSPGHLAQLLALAPTATHVDVDLIRGGQPRRLSVELGP